MSSGAVRWHDQFDQSQYIEFDSPRNRNPIIIVRDILPFMGSLLGKTIATSVGPATMVGVLAGGDPPGMDPMKTRVTMFGRKPRSDDFRIFDIGWQEVFINNYSHYRPSIPNESTKAISSFDRVIDLRGLFHGKDEAGAAGPGGGAPAVSHQEQSTSA